MSETTKKFWDNLIVDILLTYIIVTLKVLSATFLIVCFLSLKGVLAKLGNMFFISLQKLFSFSGKSNFRILHFEMS